MIIKNITYQFFDILKMEKYNTQNNLYSSGKHANSSWHGFQNNVHQNKD